MVTVFRFNYRLRPDGWKCLTSKRQEGSVIFDDYIYPAWVAWLNQRTCVRFLVSWFFALHLCRDRDERDEGFESRRDPPMTNHFWLEDSSSFETRQGAREKRSLVRSCSNKPADGCGLVLVKARRCSSPQQWTWACRGRKTATQAVVSLSICVYRAHLNRYIVEMARKLCYPTAFPPFSHPIPRRIHQIGTRETWRHLRADTKSR